jgi:hypothetical protein
MCREGVDTLKINPSGDEFVPFARAHHTVMNEAEVAAVCEVARSRGLTIKEVLPYKAPKRTEDGEGQSNPGS